MGPSLPAPHLQRGALQLQTRRREDGEAYGRGRTIPLVVEVRRVGGEHMIVGVVGGDLHVLHELELHLGEEPRPDLAVPARHLSRDINDSWMG
jgi:hypothetical protein